MEIAKLVFEKRRKSNEEIKSKTSTYRKLTILL